jgi:hypothetical protein
MPPAIPFQIRLPCPAHPTIPNILRMKKTLWNPQKNKNLDTFKHLFTPFMIPKPYHLNKSFEIITWPQGGQDESWVKLESPGSVSAALLAGP